MPQNQQVLSRSEYFRLRERYVPNHRRIIFVLESPPKSGLYFYNPDGSVSEPLFRAMMKDVVEIDPNTKDEGLREFAARGFLLIDATYTPVNHNHLSRRARNQIILDDFPLLLEDLRHHMQPSTQLVLVKANVCELLEPVLAGNGFTVLNRGKKVPFPSTGNQNKFRNTVRPMLGLTVTESLPLQYVK
jgi:hypothetical protein